MNIGVHRFFWIGVSGFLGFNLSSGVAISEFLNSQSPSICEYGIMSMPYSIQRPKGLTNALYFSWNTLWCVSSRIWNENGTYPLVYSFPCHLKFHPLHNSHFPFLGPTLRCTKWWMSNINVNSYPKFYSLTSKGNFCFVSKQNLLAIFHLVIENQGWFIHLFIYFSISRLQIIKNDWRSISINFTKY